MEHTSHPWWVNAYRQIVNGDVKIADCNGIVGVPEEELQANMRLLAAAPDLLAIAEKVLYEEGDVAVETYRALERIIAKAKGDA